MYAGDPNGRPFAPFRGQFKNHLSRRSGEREKRRAGEAEKRGMGVLRFPASLLPPFRFLFYEDSSSYVCLQ